MPKTTQGCALCTFTLPSGRRCEAVALRGQRYCRHHDDRRARVHAEFYRHMDQFGTDLDSMDLPQLLQTLRKKLRGIRGMLRVYPEAKLALFVTIERLAQLEAAGIQITHAKSDTTPQVQPNQSPAIN